MTKSFASIVLVALFVPLAASAASVSAPMNVSVVVISRAVVTVNHKADEVVVTADDVRRGFVDVSTPLVLNVRTNCRSGYSLDIVTVDPAFSAAEITSADESIRLASETSLIRPYVKGGDTLEMHVRLMLSPGAREGHYPFPLSVSANPLS